MKTKKPKILLISTLTGIPRVHRAAKTYSLKASVFILEWDRRSVLPKHETLLYADVYRFNLRAPYGYRLIFKILFWMIYLVFFCLRYRFDVIMPENLDTLVPIWVIAKLKRAKIIYDIADFYADAYIPKKLTLARRLIATIEIFLVNRVDAITIPNESVKEQIGNVDDTKVFVIYNTPEDVYEYFSCNAAYDSKISEFTKGKFTIFYGGGISEDRGLYDIIEAVRGIDDIRFLIAGFGAAEDELKDIIKHISNVHYIGKLEHNRILELTYLSSCIVIPYDPVISPNIAHASPNKLFEAMMCGKPVIAVKGTFMARVIAAYNCGILIDSKDAVKLRTAIYQLKDDLQLLTMLGKNARTAFESEYNWSLMATKLLAIIDKVILQKHTLHRE